MQEQALQLRPCVAELLRTCVSPLSLKLQIDRIVPIRAHGHEEPTKADQKIERPDRVVRVYLSDGQLIIQSLLRQSSDCPELRLGDLLELTDFEVRRSRRANGSGHVVYLAVKSFTKMAEEEELEWETGGGFLREPSTATPSSALKKPSQPLLQDSLETSSPFRYDLDAEKPPAKQLRFEELPASGQLPSRPSPNLPASDAEDDFETITPHGAAIDLRREALRNLHTESPSSRPSTDAIEEAQELQVCRENEPPAPELSGHFNLEKQSQPSTTQSPALADLPVHTLASLVHPHVRLPKSYQCTVFAIITWVSPSIITRPPFPPKRHIKIHDVSTSNQWSGVTLAVFVDATNFRPEPGTVALFRGVTMQKYGNEVILNAYKTLKDRGEDVEWLIDDVGRLAEEGWDVQGLKSWWTRRRQSRPGSRGSDKGATS